MLKKFVGENTYFEGKTCRSSTSLRLFAQADLNIFKLFREVIEVAPSARTHVGFSEGRSCRPVCMQVISVNGDRGKRR